MCSSISILVLIAATIMAIIGASSAPIHTIWALAGLLVAGGVADKLASSLVSIITFAIMRLKDEFGSSKTATVSTIAKRKASPRASMTSTMSFAFTTLVITIMTLLCCTLASAVHVGMNAQGQFLHGPCAHETKAIAAILGAGFTHNDSAFYSTCASLVGGMLCILYGKKEGTEIAYKLRKLLLAHGADATKELLVMIYSIAVGAGKLPLTGWFTPSMASCYMKHYLKQLLTAFKKQNPDRPEAEWAVYINGTQALRLSDNQITLVEAYKASAPARVPVAVAAAVAAFRIERAA